MDISVNSQRSNPQWRFDAQQALAAKTGSDNVIDLLRGWHFDLRRACSAWRAREQRHLDPGAAEQLPYQICRLVKLQSATKATIFFPSLRKLAPLADLVRQAETENCALLALAARLELMDFRDLEFSSATDVLCDNFGYHARKLESRLFPCIVRSAVDLDSLGRTLREEYLLRSEDDDPVGT